MPSSAIASWPVALIAWSACRARAGIALQHLLGRPRLKDDDAEPVREHVVQLPRDPPSLLLGGGRRELLLLALEAFGVRGSLADRPSDDPGRAEKDGGKREVAETFVLARGLGGDRGEPDHRARKRTLPWGVRDERVHDDDGHEQRNERLLQRDAGEGLGCPGDGGATAAQPARARSPAVASRSARGASPARASPKPNQPRTMSSSP